MRRPGDAVPAYSAAAFRIAFGAIALVVVVRFFAMGWIDQLYVDPPIHFPYPGFGWVRPWPGWGMHAHFGVMAAAAVGIALGWRYRVSAAVFAVLFTYVELIDQTLYLNHYYWIALTAALLTVLPLHRAWSLDALRRGWDPTLPLAVVWMLRAQVGMVYLFAGVAKLGGDWLIHGQPLATWLPARSELALIGPFLAWPATAIVASWAAALFDLTIVWWLLWGRTRLVAYLVLAAFHLTTWVLFPGIGMFPVLMVAVSPVFFAADWPRHLTGRGGAVPTEGGDRPLSRVAIVAVAVYLAVMVTVPLRHLALPGDVLWTGDGYAFSWRVMLTEKAGSVQFRVVDAATGESWVEEMPAALTARQREVVAVSPHLIAETARLIAARHRTAGRQVEVRADAFVAYNGRRSARMVDPGVDLAGDDLGTTWIVRAP